jgi:hypothetical protein
MPIISAGSSIVLIILLHTRLWAYKAWDPSCSISEPGINFETVINLNHLKGRGGGGAKWTFSPHLSMCPTYLGNHNKPKDDSVNVTEHTYNVGAWVENASTYGLCLPSKPKEPIWGRNIHWMDFSDLNSRLTARMMAISKELEFYVDSEPSWKPCISHGHKF